MADDNRLLMQGINEGLGALTGGFNQWQSNEMATEVYNTSLKRIKGILEKYQQGGEAKDQDFLTQIGQIGTQQTGTENVDPNAPVDPSKISALNIDPMPVGKKEEQKVTVQKKPVTVADLYEQVSNASARLSGLGDYGKMRAMELSNYLDVALKDKDTKLIQLGTDWYTYDKGDIANSLKRVYAPDVEKEVKQDNIIWSETVDFFERDGKYYEVHPMKKGDGSMGTYEKEISKTLYDRLEESYAKKEPRTTSSYRGNKKNPPKTDYSYGDDMKATEVKNFAGLQKQIEAMGGLAQVEAMAKDPKNKDAINLLTKYNEKYNVVASYGLDPDYASDILMNSSSQDEFEEGITDLDEQLNVAKSWGDGIFTDKNAQDYANSKASGDGKYANEWDKWFWETAIKSAYELGIPENVVEREIKERYYEWRDKIAVGGGDQWIWK